MAYATQITIISGRKGARKSAAYVLGGECATTRQAIRDLLGLKGLEDIETDGFEGGTELDGLGLTLALRARGTEIEALDDTYLRAGLTALMAHWLMLDDRDEAFAIAELI